MVKVKKINCAEVESAAGLFNEYRMFYGQSNNIDGARSFLTERLQKEESVIFVATEHDVAIGFCQLYPIFSSVSMQKAWLLNDLYVTVNARKKGVAVALLDHAHQLGKETKAKWLLLQTTEDNVTAQSVYEKNGWKRVTDFFYELPV